MFNHTNNSIDFAWPNKTWKKFCSKYIWRKKLIGMVTQVEYGKYGLGYEYNQSIGFIEVWVSSEHEFRPL